MYILDIIPLRKGIPRDTLSYFSVRDVPVGALVEIPLQSKTINGIVIRKTEARDMKASIRTGSFSLKAIGTIIEEKGFPSKLLQTLQTISFETLIPIGTLITTFFPDPLFEYFQAWKQLSSTKSEIRIIELPTNERHDYYRLLIREAFAKKQSIQFVCPTTIENDYLAQFLKKSVEDNRLFSISGGSTPIKREKIYEQIKESTEPIVICSTPQFSMIPKNDIGSCIIDSSNSPYYAQDFKWNIDFRPILLQIMETLGYTRYLADSISSPEQFELVKTRKAFVERTTKIKPTDAIISIIEKEQLNNPRFISPIFSSETLAYIHESLKKKEPVFIFSARKGVATTTTCRDCGYTVTCPNCTAVMQLIKKNPLLESDRVFSCNRCETEIPAMNRCPDCLGWNLIALGITTDSLANELRKFFPTINVFESTTDTTKTESACKKMVTAWTESAGILVGTQKIISYLNNIPFAIIASFEHCMSVPHFETPFQTLWLMNKLYEKTTSQFIIQTKETKHPLLLSFANNDIHEFIREDSILRKEYHYPPFAALITLTMDHISRKDHLRAKDFLKNSLKSFDHTIQSHFFEHSQQYTLLTHVHIPMDLWKSPDYAEKRQLMAFLESVRDYIDISIETGLI